MPDRRRVGGEVEAEAAVDLEIDKLGDRMRPAALRTVAVGNQHRPVLDGACGCNDRGVVDGKHGREDPER